MSLQTTTNYTTSVPVTDLDTGVINSKLSKQENESLIAVLSKLSGKNVTTSQLASMKFSEEILYAATVHSELKKTSPALLTTFMDELKVRYDRRVVRNDTQPIAKAINDILDNGVASKKISSSQYNHIIGTALGESQLNNSRASVGNALFNGGTAKIESLTSKNKVATKEQIAQFEKSVSTLQFQAPSITRAQSANMQKIFDSLKTVKKKTPSATPTPPKTKPTKTTPTKKKTTDESGSVKTTTPDPTLNSTPNDFDYRVKSETDGHLLIRLPIGFGRDISSVELRDTNGKVLEEQPLKEKGSDERYYFRFSKAGSSYKELSSVVIHYSRGTEMAVSIPDNSENFSERH